MFFSPQKRLAALLDVVDDMLLGAPDDVETVIAAPHPHRRPVRLQLERRPGSVARRQMDCVCPVRTPAASPPDHELSR